MSRTVGDAGCRARRPDAEQVGVGGWHVEVYETVFVEWCYGAVREGGRFVEPAVARVRGRLMQVTHPGGQWSACWRCHKAVHLAPDCGEHWCQACVDRVSGFLDQAPVDQAVVEVPFVLPPEPAPFGGPAQEIRRVPAVGWRVRSNDYCQFGDWALFRSVEEALAHAAVELADAPFGMREAITDVRVLVGQVPSSEG